MAPWFPPPRRILSIACLALALLGFAGCGTGGESDDHDPAKVNVVNSSTTHTGQPNGAWINRLWIYDAYNATLTSRALSVAPGTASGFIDLGNSQFDVWVAYTDGTENRSSSPSPARINPGASVVITFYW